MTHRVRFTIAAMTSLVLGTATLPAQSLKPAPAAKNAAWVQGKTPDGQPDLQGTWTNASNVPLQRPKELGAKEFFTAQEQADFQAKANGFAGDRANLPEAHYDLSQFGLDRSQGKFAPNLRTSIIIGTDGRLPAYTADGQKRIAARAAALKGHETDGPESRNLGERCIMNNAGGPPMLPSGYNNDLEIVQGPGYVAIMQEMIHDTRIIPLDGRPHAPAGVRSYRGDSRGRWEGNTLVVDTTNFNDNVSFNRIPVTNQFHVIERFTRTGPETISYQFTVEDPGTWVKPFTGEIVMGPAPGRIFEYACHEANHSMENLLSSARNNEKEAAEKNKK